MRKNRTYSLLVAGSLLLFMVGYFAFREKLL